MALRPHTEGRLSVVFGCGGERDTAKRPVMGEIAGRHADHVIVTDDNPRNEDADDIRAEVVRGCPAASQMGDRAEAIHRAVADLGPGDILLIAGKGHETGQIVKGDVRPFDDRSVARDAVANLSLDFS